MCPGLHTITRADFPEITARAASETLLIIGGLRDRCTHIESLVCLLSKYYLSCMPSRIDLFMKRDKKVSASRICYNSCVYNFILKHASLSLFCMREYLKIKCIKNI